MDLLTDLHRLHRQLWCAYRDRGFFAMFCLLDKLDLEQLLQLVEVSGPVAWTEVDPRLLMLPGANDVRSETLWACRPVETWTRLLVIEGVLPCSLERLSVSAWRDYMGFLRGPQGMACWRRIKRRLDSQRRVRPLTVPAGSRCRTRSGL